MRQLAHRLRQPRVLLAITLLGLTGGLILAALVARGDLVGADARAYWGAVRLWLGGGDPYAPGGVYLPYAYAPWTLVIFLPWALLPWEVAWFSWTVMNVAFFAWSVGWAYRRRPLATAVLVAMLGVPLAAHLDTGNVGLLLVLAIWLSWFASPRVGGLAWAIAAAMKWAPALLIFFIPPRARLWGVVALGVMALLTLATFPDMLRQLDVVLNFPRPVRVDYLLLAWGAVPWLWSQPSPAWWRNRAELARRWRERPSVIEWAHAFFGLDHLRPAGTAGTSTHADSPRPSD
ncbi:MAG TPA: glycosyltransferase family 87 protein [Candidatus Limnocylindrales bacterium]|nr:glycosyltransferase family 87 protein [Candidatus Limnocylindrales bacterium]